MNVVEVGPRDGLQNETAPISTNSKVAFVDALSATGVGEIEVKRLLDLLLPIILSDRIAMHFHDTYGRGVENVLASWSYGIRTFDSSVGALGGLPFCAGGHR